MLVERNKVLFFMIFEHFEHSQLPSSFLDFILNIFTVILYINDVIIRGIGGISKDDMMTGRRGGLK